MQSRCRRRRVVRRSPQRALHQAADSIVIDAITSHIELLTQQLATTETLIRNHFEQHPHLKAQRDLIVSIPGIAAPGFWCAEISTTFRP